MREEHTYGAYGSDTPPFWSLLWRSPKFFFLVTLAAFTLRLVFFFKFPHVMGDTLIYGDIAKNWLTHGIFGLTHPDGVHPTLIRLPGYPAFLAACFLLFGREHYNAVLLVQIVVDIITCFFIADLTRRTVSARAARFAFVLAALCPYTANYTAAPLTETLSIFFVAVALDAAGAGLATVERGQPAWSAWSWCGVAVACGILLRPDGGILLAALGLYLLWRICRKPRERIYLFGAGVLVLAISIAPLVPWTIRNWRVFHLFQPLVTETASDPDEFVPENYDRWVKTWSADYVSTEDILWQVPGDKVDPALLPSRAFDSPEQREATQALIAEYNKTFVVSPVLDARFKQLADVRIRARPFRYYVWLPTLRAADMWLRPRTEMLPLSTRWWEYAEDPQGSILATLWGVLNLLFVVAAALGAISGPRPQYLGLMLLCVLLRSAFLGTLPNPEPRYTLECYPVVLLLGAGWLARYRAGRLRPAPASVPEDR